MTQPIGVFITFWAAPGQSDALLSEVRAIMQTVRDEAGTIAYGFHRVTEPREGIAVYELYTDAGAQKTHNESAAIAALKARIGPLLSGPPERIRFVGDPGSKGLPF